jgi:hypothetical protein
MAETLVEEKSTEKDIYGITPEVREKYRKKLEQMIAEKKLKVFTEKDFDFPKDEKKQAKIRAEVDEFLRMREEWRKEDRDRISD